MIDLVRPGRPELGAIAAIRAREFTEQEQEEAAHTKARERRTVRTLLPAVPTELLRLQHVLLLIPVSLQPNA